MEVMATGCCGGCCECIARYFVRLTATIIFAAGIAIAGWGGLFVTKEPSSFAETPLFVEWFEQQPRSCVTVTWFGELRSPYGLRLRCQLILFRACIVN